MDELLTKRTEVLIHATTWMILKTLGWVTEATHKGHMWCDSMPMKWSEWTRIGRQTARAVTGLGRGKNGERLVIGMGVIKTF